MEMFDEVKRYVMSDNEQLIEIVDRRQAELDWQEAQMWFANLSGKWECTKDPAVRRDLDVAESRLIQLFMEGGWHSSSTNEIMNLAWDAYTHYLLYHHAKQS